MTLTATNCDYTELNESIRQSQDSEIIIKDCCGQRYIGAGLSGRTVHIEGVPGNALGAYLEGADIIVNGNAQDAVGDTMNDGSIIIDGRVGDTLGYAMRGGKIYVRGDAGYRTGIHMKQYGDKKPVLVIGGCVGSFLGEYLAGGVIAVLGLGCEDKPLVGNFTGTGMHGGKIFLRCDKPPQRLPEQVSCRKAGAEDMREIEGEIAGFAEAFGLSKQRILDADFFVLEPNTGNPYHQLYVAN